MLTVILTVGTFVWAFRAYSRRVRDERDERFANAIVRLDDRNAD